MNTAWSFVKSVAKAIASGLAALVGTIVLALDLQPADHQGIQFLTQAQWGIIILAVLASYGITWRIPNQAGELPGETTGANPSPSLPVATQQPIPASQQPIPAGTQVAPSFTPPWAGTLSAGTPTTGSSTGNPEPISNPQGGALK